VGRLFLNFTTRSRKIIRCSLLLFFSATPSFAHGAQSSNTAAKLHWKSVEFAIVRFNDEAPKSWDIYHTDKRGVLLVRIWKRMLLVDIPQQLVFDIDPAKVETQGDGVDWSPADIPDDPLAVLEWKERNVGPVQRVRIRLGKEGPVLELQLPMKADGKPAY
jgi:hypothetical protein